MNCSSVNNSFSFNQDQIRMPVKRQLQFLERVRKNHVERTNQAVTNKGITSIISLYESSNEELFADIEKVRNNQNSSRDSKKEQRSQTVDQRSSYFEKAIHQFNGISKVYEDSSLLIMNNCDQEIYNDENIQVEEENLIMMDKINEVFQSKNSDPRTPSQAHISAPPTNSSLYATPESKKLSKGYGKSILSTEISNEPEPQRQYHYQTQTPPSIQSNSSEKFEVYQQYNQTNQSFQPLQYQEDYNDQYYQDNQYRKRKSISDEDSHMFVINQENVLIKKINTKIGHDKRTTMMIKNIPNKYTIQLLLDQIDKKYQKTYDFFYLPIDFKNRCNMGYAFINFVDIKYIKWFYDELHGKRWPHFNSEKICDLRYARIQGQQALIQHFQFSSIMNQKDKKLKPVILPQSELSKFQMLIQRQQQNQSHSEQFFHQ